MKTGADRTPDSAYAMATLNASCYGLSQRVAAERLSPWEYVGGQGFGYENVGDKFHESYTYGPVGVTTRTDEQQDADPQTGRDHYVMADVFGGTTGLLAKVGTGAREPVFQHFDAFGVRVGVDSTWSADYDASRYRWRSQEGSETDDLAVSDNYAVGLQPPTLVYMQTRHYDPALGRFIMADSIPMGAFSPQGLNRYAYCTNDPVNGSDASGRLFLGLPIVFLLVLAVMMGMPVAAVPLLITLGLGGFAALLGIAGGCLIVEGLDQAGLLGDLQFLGLATGALGALLCLAGFVCGMTVVLAPLGAILTLLGLIFIFYGAMVLLLDYAIGKGWVDAGWRHRHKQQFIPWGQLDPEVMYAARKLRYGIGGRLATAGQT